jgi:hypothetical protein
VNARCPYSPPIADFASSTMTAPSTPTVPSVAAMADFTLSRDRWTIPPLGQHLGEGRLPCAGRPADQDQDRAILHTPILLQPSDTTSDQEQSNASNRRERSEAS